MGYSSSVFGYSEFSIRYTSSVLGFSSSVLGTLVQYQVLQFSIRYSSSAFGTLDKAQLYLNKAEGPRGSRYSGL